MYGQYSCHKKLLYVKKFLWGDETNSHFVNILSSFKKIYKSKFYINISVWKLFLTCYSIKFRILSNLKFCSIFHHYKVIFKK